jgi:aminoglycoside phosphotransferase (APT) family kinase protein
MTAAVPGTLIGSGRNADVYDLTGGRVLRRYRDGRDAEPVAAEALIMTRARAAGVPVPEVFDVSGADIVMERAAGPTMLDTLGRRPWTMLAQAGLLARLHDLVHKVPLSSLPELAPLPGWTGPADGDVLLHRDLHPQNVILTERGPMIIDWEGAARGPAMADVGLTWTIIGFSDVPLPPVRAALVRTLQSAFTRSFVRAAGPLDETWRTTVVRMRLTDHNLLPSEAARLRKLVTAAPRPDGDASRA